MRLTLGAWHARYMVVLRMGGVYMDGDVECRRPLDELILPGDTLVAGWEAEFPNASIARAKEYVRKRQVQALNIGSFLVKLYILLDGSPAEQLLLDDTLEASRGGTPPRVMQRHSKGIAYTHQVSESLNFSCHTCWLLHAWASGCSVQRAQAMSRSEDSPSVSFPCQTRQAMVLSQVLQWAFAAAPGHPALRQVCEHIARHEGELISADARRDVLERTGPGPWTDAVLRHARLRPLSKVRFHRSPELLLQWRKGEALGVTASVLGLGPWTGAVLKHARLQCLSQVPLFDRDARS